MASITPSDDRNHTQDQQQSSPALSSASSPSPDRQQSNGSTSPDQESSHSSSSLPLHQITVAVSVILPLLALRGGFFNIILVLATAAALLLNPYVRTFLDLPAQIGKDGQPITLGPLDPAKYFTSFTQPAVTPESDSAVQSNKDESDSQDSQHKAKELLPLPDHVRESIDQLATLVVRDFVQGWYTHHSFGYPNFPDASRNTIDYMAASIWTRAVHSRLHSVDVATELLLTASSVFLTCLRRKRYANHAAAAGDRMAAKAAMRGGTGHWTTNQERIASLRSAMRAFFARHLPPSESRSALVFPLLTEILTKQLWNLLLTVGEPDFLNRNLVGWKEKQLAAAAASPQSQSTTHTHTQDSPINGQRTTTQPPLPSRPPQSGIFSPPSRPSSTKPALQTPPSPVASPTQQPPPVERPPSVPPRPSMSSASSGGPGPPLLIPDRGMISTPPSRTDSPMMPSFASTQRAPTPSRIMSPMRTSMDCAPSPANGAQYSQYQRQQPGRTSTDLSDGLSAVVGGLGTVIKGVGKGADAIVGGVGDVLTSSGEHHPEATPERLRQQPFEQRQPPPHRIASPDLGMASHEVWRRSPSSVDRASTNPEVLQQQHNAVKRKHPPKKENDLTDLMASQAAWPSNLPPGLDKSAEGENLPPSLASSLRRQTTSPAKSRSAASPPKMNTSLPYEISPRTSMDNSAYYRMGYGQVSSSSRSNSPIVSSQPQANPSGPPSRPPSSLRQQQSTPSLPPRPHPGMSSVPAAPSLSSVLSRSDPQGLYDDFEAFLEGSSPSLISASVPGEGEELLRLQVGLGTIARLVPRSAGEEAEMFREDASTILAKARDGLERAASRVNQNGSASDSDSRAQSIKAIINRLNDSIEQLGFGPQGFSVKQGTVRDALEPVEAELSTRLQTLYALFYKYHCDARKQQQWQPSTAPPAMHGGLSYEPRKRESATAQPVTPPNTATPTSVKRTSLQAPKPRQAILDHLISLDDDDEDDGQSSINHGSSSVFDELVSGGSGGGGGGGGGPRTLNVSVTDISPNADRPDGPVDLRTFEFICAVEGSDAEDGGGYVLVRRWSEVVTLQKELRKVVLVGGATVPGLPNTKGRSSTALCLDLEAFLATILSTPELGQTSPVAQFADRTRAGTSSAAAAAAARTGFNPFSSGVEFGRTLGKNLVDGVGAVGKAAATGLQIPAAGGGSRQAGGTPSGKGGSYATLQGNVAPSSSSSTLTTDSAVTGLLDTAERNASASASASTSASPSTSTGGGVSTNKTPQGLTARGLDAILTSIFALADEALSLTGAWSMRRGVVRLLQSVVRQSYSSSIVSAFEGVSSSLSSTSISSTLDFIRTTFWADGPDAKFTHVKGPPRSAKERLESEEKAREIVKGYAPTQAAFVLGPGGKQACEKALEAVHGVICDDEGALDLALTLTLRMLQML